MNRKIASALVIAAAAAAGNAFAEGPIESNDRFVGAKSRDAVQAELAAYKQAGVNPWSTQYNPLRSFSSSTTREAVVADYIASREHVAAFNGEDSGSVWLATAGQRSVSDTLAGRPARAE